MQTALIRSIQFKIDLFFTKCKHDLLTKTSEKISWVCDKILKVHVILKKNDRILSYNREKECLLLGIEST